ncbi:hypothetical protein LEN26_017062 [Aphanomyces euteiches]|nr:hypothetical protein LEN26_017062 [Aphanomyces euteiches]KAH9111974.1 hypothetical protein AeMF1_013594 [Aphanomyces euteiches]KAH9193510.1 hypothetical protein AeNC1_004512 [Aphanomyces euteiches]
MERRKLHGLQAAQDEDIEPPGEYMMNQSMTNATFPEILVPRGSEIPNAVDSYIPPAQKAAMSTLNLTVCLVAIVAVLIAAVVFLALFRQRQRHPHQHYIPHLEAENTKSRYATGMLVFDTLTNRDPAALLMSMDRTREEGEPSIVLETSGHLDFTSDRLMDIWEDHPDSDNSDDTESRTDV